MSTVRERLLDRAEQIYGVQPDRPFATAPDYQVLRHRDSGRWFALLMDIPASRLGIPEDRRVDIVDLKCDPALTGVLRDWTGVFPAYHMSRQSWITVLLDGAVALEDILPLLDMSFELTRDKKKRSGSFRATDWLIPANPRYYDIEEGIAENPEHIFNWKQSNSIAVGDTVYIYMAAPVSAVRYKCRAVEVDIPCDYADENVRMTRLMRLQLLRRYDGPPVGRDILQDHGVNAVRGPRSMPKSLIEAIGVLYPEDGDVAGSCLVR